LAPFGQFNQTWFGLDWIGLENLVTLKFAGRRKRMGVLLVLSFGEEGLAQKNL